LMGLGHNHILKVTAEKQQYCSLIETVARKKCPSGMGKHSIVLTNTHYTTDTHIREPALMFTVSHDFSSRLLSHLGARVI